MKTKKIMISIFVASIMSPLWAGPTNFPPAGTDVFSSQFNHGLIKFIDGNPYYLPPALPDLTYNGPTTVVRGEPGSGQIQTEIVSMTLTSTFDPGSGPITVTIKESSERESKGLVRELNPSPADDFPAESFFDVFFEIEIDILPGIMVYNIDPAYVYLPHLTELPPMGDTYELRGWIEKEHTELIGNFIDLSAPPDGFNPLPTMDKAGALPLYVFDGDKDVLVGHLYGSNAAGHTPVPAPGAFLLGSLGVGCVGWLKRHRSI